jgi:hypothetical protein
MHLFLRLLIDVSLTSLHQLQNLGSGMRWKGDNEWGKVINLELGQHFLIEVNG